MTGKERREEYALENLIQDAYDFSDDQILKELEETEATLSDSDFPGIEDRIYQKLKTRMAAEETVSETVAEEAAEETAPAKEQKVVKFGKRKAAVVGILAAAFVGMLGVTAIGEKNYFFRDSDVEIGIAYDNDRNISFSGDLEYAYKEIEDALDISMLKLEYIPEEMIFKEARFTENNISLIFKYKDKMVYFIQEFQNDETSVGVNSDRRKIEESIYNDWILKDIILEEESLEKNGKGYAFTVSINKARYHFFGQLPKDEIIKIAKNLKF